MYRSGNITVFVADMDRSIDFYTNVLGLALRVRHGNHWAEVNTPQDLVIGLHPTAPDKPAPGTPGPMHIGLYLAGTLDDAMKTLTERGVSFDKVLTEEGVGRFAYLKDPDGNPIYLWEMAEGLEDGN